MSAVERLHGADCGCVRCVGFQPGHELTLKHGAYSKLKLAPRAEQLCDEYMALVPFGSEADRPIVSLLAMAMAQAERAGLVLTIEQAESAKTGVSSDRLDRLSSDMRGWINTAARLLDQLGMSPTSRARLAGDLAGAQRALTAQSLREKYAAEEAA